MSDINDVLPKMWPEFLSDHEIITLTRLNISAPSFHYALYPPMCVVVGLLGPIPRSDNPSQDTYTLGTCQTSMMCCQRCGQNFCQIMKLSPLQDSISVHHLSIMHFIHLCVLL